MSDYELSSGSDGIALNNIDTVGIMAYQHFTDDDAQTAVYNPQFLVEWANAVADAFEDEGRVELVLSDGAPLIAREHNPDDEEARVGLSVAPLITGQDYGGDE